MRWAILSKHNPELLANIKNLQEDDTYINKQNEKGFTALMLACANNNGPATKILIDKGAEINMCASDKKTALMLASECNAHDIVILLLKYGANIYAQDNDDMTALTIAAKYNSDETVKILKKVHCQSKANQSYSDNAPLLITHNNNT